MATLPYSVPFKGPTLLQKGQINALTAPVYRNGALVAPSGGTCTVYGPASEVVSTGSVTVAANIATYTVSSSSLSSFSLGDGWRVEWALTLSGTVHTFRTSASLVHRLLYPVLSDLDLQGLHTDMATLQGGVTVQGYLDEAWVVIEGKLLQSGRRPWLNLEPSSLRQAHKLLSLALWMRDRATGGPGTPEWELAAHYEGAFEKEWKALSFPEATQEGEATAGGRKRRSASPLLVLC